jgi:AcrR family transcriptional regulator
MSRREDILSAAVELFAERGFQATPTSEVAKRAGVAEGTIFHHFKTKDEILLSIFEQLMDAYLEGFEAAAKQAGNGLDAIEKAIRFHFRFSDDRSKEVSVMVRDFPSDITDLGSPHREVVTGGLMRLMDLWTKLIEQGKKDGSIRQMPAQEATFILRGLLIGLSRLKLLGPIKPPDLSAQVIDFCRRGLGSQTLRRGERARGREIALNGGPP